MKRPLLDSVTICAADTASPALAARALEISMAHCRFADAILFTDRDIPGAHRTVHISTLSSREAYSDFILRELNEHVDTAYVLVVQWDGYVIDPSTWTSDFMSYDYIGAKCPWHQYGMAVGNGGFSLRSKRLLEAVCAPGFRFVPAAAEDDLICRVNRRHLEGQFGIRFAPEALADRFSYERTLPTAPTFGFHGLFNMWRHVDYSEMSRLIDSFTPYMYEMKEFTELEVQYFMLGKFDLFSKMYKITRGLHGLDAFRHRLAQWFGDAAWIKDLIGSGEALLDTAP